MSAADADQLRQAWDYIERNGFCTGYTGYVAPGDECPACALGAMAYTAKLDLTKAPEHFCQLTWIVAQTRSAARWLVRAREVRSRLSEPTDNQDIALAIFRHNDNRVRAVDEARQWFARAIELAEAHA